MIIFDQTQADITLTLPRPPSVNSIYANNYGAGNGRYKTPAYKSWEKEASKLLLLQTRERIITSVIVAYIYHRPNRKKVDVANFEKALSDLLVNYNVLEDDSQIHGIWLAWDSLYTGHTPPEKCVKVFIKKLTDGA